MATVRREIQIHSHPDRVWDVIRDVGAVHTRLAPGFVVNTQLEENARLVTFANGMVARELLVTIDEEARRLVYSVIGGSATHHNASFQVFPEGDRISRLVWITDILPHTVAPGFEAMIDAGCAAIHKALDNK
jgi:carbon monoxide dehydrogenase subunit G